MKQESDKKDASSEGSFFKEKENSSKKISKDIMRKKRSEQKKEKIEKYKKKTFKEKMQQHYRDVQSFELNEDTLKVSGDWPFFVKIISTLLLIVSILLAANQFHFKGQNLKLKKLQVDETALKQDVVFKIQQTSGMNLYEDRIVDMERSFESQLSQLPTDIEMDGLLRDITEVGMTNGVEFKKFKMLDEEEFEFYIEIPIEIIVMGTYHSLSTFISDVSNLDRIVTFHDFTLKNQAVGKSDLLELNITSKTYKYRKTEVISE